MITAVERAQVHVDRVKAKRAAAWQRIQTEAPDVAELMRRVREVFGPGAGRGATVEIGGQRVWPVEGGTDGRG